uniref:Uncharacterized protein n=1 Tax=Romanomermis culicivorax TaxID=13658 RepID=A0A915KV63_ROMCU
MVVELVARLWDTLITIILSTHLPSTIFLNEMRVLDDFFDDPANLLIMSIIPIGFREESFVENGADIGMWQEVGSNNTLIVAMVVKDDAFVHMFSEGGFHDNNDRTMSHDDISVGNFDLATNGE